MAAMPGLSRARAEECVEQLPPVLHLDFPGRPATVFRGVVAVGVDAVKRHIWRALTHVGHEVQESIGAKPTFADRNAAPAIDGVPSASWIEASKLHCIPRLIRPVALSRHAMSCRPCRPEFGAQAAARLDRTAAQIGAVCLVHRSAVASAEVARVPLVRGCDALDYDQSSIAIPRRSRMAVLCRKRFAFAGALSGACVMPFAEATCRVGLIASLDTASAGHGGIVTEMAR